LLGAAGVVLTAAGEAGLLASLAPVCLALACAALLIVALESAPARRCLLPFAALGRMAFTHYILQSLIFGAIFFGYGLGQFGKLAPAPVFVLGVGVRRAVAVEPDLAAPLPFRTYRMVLAYADVWPPSADETGDMIDFFDSKTVNFAFYKWETRKHNR
jgi:hypothetical protein